MDANAGSCNARIEILEYHRRSQAVASAPLIWLPVQLGPGRDAGHEGNRRDLVHAPWPPDGDGPKESDKTSKDKLPDFQLRAP